MNTTKKGRKLVLRMIAFICCLGLFFPSWIGLANDSVFDCLQDDRKCEDQEDDKGINLPADNQEDAPQKERSSVGLTPGDYIKSFVALVFVVILLYSLLKWMNRKNRLDNKNRLMKNLGGISLGQQKSIQLVHVGNTYYLVGVGEDIQLLKVIDDPEEIDMILAQYEEVEEVPFQGMFEQMLAKLSPFKQKQADKPDPKQEAFSEVFHHRLDEIKAARKNQLKQLTVKERDKDD